MQEEDSQRECRLWVLDRLTTLPRTAQVEPTKRRPPILNIVRTEETFSAEEIAEEWLTTAETASRLDIKPKTLRNQQYNGTWTQGVLWFKRPGLRVRWRWRAVVVGLKAGTTTAAPTRPDGRRRRQGSLTKL